MASEDEIFDSPTQWVRAHVQDYVESDGQKGHRWRGLPTLLLTTRGRKTGKLRRTGLIYGQDGPHYLLVASNGGAPCAMTCRPRFLTNRSIYDDKHN